MLRLVLDLRLQSIDRTVSYNLKSYFMLLFTLQGAETEGENQV